MAVTNADLLANQNEWFEHLDRLLHRNLERGRKIMAELDDLEREVGEIEDGVGSAVALLDGLKTMLDEALASGDMGRVQAVRDRIDGAQQRLAEAVVRNTPADPNAGGGAGGGGTEGGPVA